MAEQDDRELDKQFNAINRNTVYSTASQANSIEKKFQKMKPERERTERYLSSLNSDVNADVNRLWSSRNPIVIRQLENMRNTLAVNGETDLPDVQTTADEAYALTENQQVGGVTRYQRFNAHLSEAHKRVVGVYGDPKELEQKEKTLEELDSQIAKAKAEGNSSLLLKLKSQKKRLQANLLGQTKKWMKNALNVEALKRLIYSESMKQSQLAQILFLGKAGYKYARWCLSPTHPKDDVCDICAKHIWLTKAEEEEVLALGIKNLGGIFRLDKATKEGLLIPELETWSDRDIKRGVLHYGDGIGGKPDTRRKLAGRMPAHPWCKCFIRPLLGSRRKKK